MQPNLTQRRVYSESGPDLSASLRGETPLPTSSGDGFMGNGGNNGGIGGGQGVEPMGPALGTKRKERTFLPDGSPATYVPASFTYNTRVAAVLIPVIAILFMFAGSRLTGLCVVGVIGAYALDGVGKPMASLLTVISVFLLAGVMIVVEAFESLDKTLYNLALVQVMGYGIVLVALWYVLQNDWLHTYGPIFLLTSERVIWSTGWMVAGTLEAWALSAVTGSTSAPFFLSLMLCINYGLLGGPDGLPSSYLLNRDLPIVSSLESTVGYMVLVGLPYTFYFALHTNTLEDDPYMHWSNLALLVSLPVYTIYFLNQRPGAWHTMLTAAFTPLAIFAFEYRVVFAPGGFAPYIPLPVPMNYVLVTGLLVGLVVIALLLRMGIVLEHKPTLFVVSLLTTTVGSVAIGMPFLLFPVAQLATGMGIAFFFSRKAGAWWTMVGSLAILMIWFQMHSWTFLSYTFANLHIGLDVMAALLVVLAVLAGSAPGLQVSTIGGTLSRQSLTSFVLTAYGVGFCVAEFVLTDAHTPGMYPIWLVVLTTVVGIVLSTRAFQRGLINHGAASACLALFIGKLGLLLPEPGSAMPRTIIMAFPIVRLAYLSATRADGKPVVSTMSRRAALVHVLGIGTAVFVGRKAVFTGISLVVWGREPSFATILAGVIVLWSLALFPMVTRWFPGVSLVRRTVLGMLVFGLVLGAVQPEAADIHGGAVRAGWAVDTEAVVSATSGTVRPGWIPWVLVSGAVLAFAGATGAVPLTGPNYGTRALYSAGLGGSMGLYLAAEYFPLYRAAVGGEVSAVPWSVQLLSSGFGVIVTFICVNGMAAGSGPGGADVLQASSSNLSGLYFVLHAVYLPVQIIGAGWAYGASSRGAEAAWEVRELLIGLAVTVNVLIGLSIRGGVAAAAALAPVGAPAARGRGGDSMSVVENGPLGTVANFGVIVGYLGAVAINVRFLEGSLVSAVVLSPLLLLVGRDPTLFPTLFPGNRYLPLVAIPTVTLGLGSALEIAEAWSVGPLGVEDVFGGLEDDEGTGISGGEAMLSFALLGLMVMPMYHLIRWAYFAKKASRKPWIVLMPICVATVVLGSVGSLQALGLFVGIGGAVVLLTERQAKADSHKML